MDHESPFGNRTSTSSVAAHSAIANGPYVGPSLTPWQYEALCRHVLAREYAIPMHEIKTGYLESPSKTRHQIDLYWTSRDGVCNFLCFANAKFQNENIILTQVMTLLGVQRDIRAHKAMLITNTGYSQTAVDLARENGIALLIVRPAPSLDVAVLPQSTAPAVAQALEKIAVGLPSVYHLNIVHRGLEPKATAPAAAPPPCLSLAPCPEPGRRANKMISTPANPGRAPGPFGIRRK